MENQQTVFYLVRHGESENNVLHILNSYPEAKSYPLTEHGRKQIDKVATNDLSETDVDVIFSSPIRRARETAGIIAQEKNMTVLEDKRLRETDFGIFDGGPVSDLLAKYPDPAKRVETDGSDGVEGFNGMRTRLRSFLDDVRKQYAGKIVVVVSHGDTLEQLHGLILGESAADAARGWYPAKGSCTRVVA